MKKGQVLSVDIIIALLGFMGIIVFLIWGWQTTSVKLSAYDQSQDLYTLAYFASESLVQTSGVPLNWSSQSSPSRSTISSIGLQNGSYISMQKIQSLANLNSSYYTQIKEVLGILGPNYDIQIDYYFDNGTAFVKNSALTFGQMYSSGSVVSISRLFVLDNASSTVGRMQVFVSGGLS
jgi:hypothetical protein